MSCGLTRTWKMKFMRRSQKLIPRFSSSMHERTLQSRFFIQLSLSSLSFEFRASYLIGVVQKIIWLLSIHTNLFGMDICTYLISSTPLIVTLVYSAINLKISSFHDFSLFIQLKRRTIYKAQIMGTCMDINRHRNIYRKKSFVTNSKNILQHSIHNSFLKLFPF